MKPRSDEGVLLASGSMASIGSEAESRPVVSIADVTKVVRQPGASAVVALDGVTLDVDRGEFVCLLGASGCGKSTLLNLVAGLDQPTTGRVDVRAERTGADVPGGGAVPVAHRPRATSRSRSSSRGVPRADAAPRAQELLEMVHLGDFAKRRPHELSGGMRQRVALARALAQDADVLLMDEPFGALDAMTRDRPPRRARSAVDSTGKTVIFVTHNVREAVRLGDCVVLLASRPGRVAAVYDVTIPPAPPHRLARGRDARGDDHRPAARGGARRGRRD